MQKLYYARINRRQRRGEGQGSFAESSFRDELAMMADSHDLVWHDKNAKRTWIAADLAWTADGEFVTGILGYKESRLDKEFDEASWSWAKGEEEARDTASDRTLVPFAIDAHDDNRFVAFIPTSGLRRGGFRRGLEKCLQAAVAKQQILGHDWEVDLIAEEGQLRAWLADHPNVFRLTRVVRFTNPGRKLDEDRAAMEALDARTLTETFAARRGKTLDTNTQEFEESIAGIEDGFVDIRLQARGPNGRGEVHFRTDSSAAGVDVEAGPTIEMQRDTVLDLLRAFRNSRRARRLRDE